MYQKVLRYRYIYPNICDGGLLFRRRSELFTVTYWYIVAYAVREGFEDCRES